MAQGTSVKLEISDFYGDEYLSRGLLSCDAVQCCGRLPTFRKTLLSYTQHYRVSQLRIFRF